MMNEDTNVYSLRALELRRAFDRSFAAAPDTAPDELESVLAFSVAGDRFAVRLLEIGGMAKCSRIVPIPNHSRALLGLAGIRGELLPVYSLPELLGYAAIEEIRWLLLCAGPTRAGLGIGDFRGCFKAPKTAFSATERPVGQAQPGEVVAIGSEVHTVISISSLTQSIGNPKEGV